MIPLERIEKLINILELHEPLSGVEVADARAALEELKQMCIHKHHFGYDRGQVDCEICGSEKPNGD